MSHPLPTRTQRHAVWPRQTAPTSLPIPPNRKRRRALCPRQTIADMSSVIEAEEECQVDSGNEVISCYPTAGIRFNQEDWASFVWNSRRPEITQFNLVDIFLFRADSGEQILHFPNVTNPRDQAGLLRTKVNDTWFGTDGLSWAGSNLTFPYCWVLIRSEDTLDGSQISQAVFTAVQTTVLDSVASSSSASAAASSSSARAASLSSSLSSASVAESSSTGSVQHASSSNSSFPHWAIAVIVVLGFLAIVASCTLVFFILRRLRRRREKDSNRNSMGSASPMIARDNNNTQEMAQTYDSPPLPTHTGIPAITTGISPSIPTGNITTDAASTTSDGGGALSGADAAIIADAFRKKLRKPDFAVQEGDSPDSTGERERETEAAGNVVLSRELAEEGRDIRYVSSSKGVKVESSQS